jgi:hypothetical protein
VTPQTPFILGSTSKSFTALAIMQLVEAGKIDLDAPVTKYLPWFRTADKAASAQITVRRLLNQNSGLPVSEGLENLSENDQSDTALENGVRQLADVQLSHPAGQTFEYANENYTILGLIIIKRWQHRGELPLRRMRRFWRYVLPLGVDLCLATLAWPIVPRLVHAPMATISLFAPDVFLSIVLITSLGLGWALARTIVTFRPPVKTVIKKGESYAEVSGTA